MSTNPPTTARPGNTTTPTTTRPAPSTTRPAPPTTSGNGTPEPPSNVHFRPDGSVGIPGRGMSLTWSPSGTGIAVGGHFRDKETRRRYDTRTIDVPNREMVKSFNCHYFWTLAHAWSNNPYLGEVIVDGGDDHAVKIWDANGSGAPKCKSPGQFLASEGGIKQLPNINGSTMSLQFSPDGKWLVGASRDRSVRIWQIAPGPNQFKVVKLWWNRDAGNQFSVRWSPEGTRLAVGDRKGHVSEWAFNAANDLWPQETIDDFAKAGWSGHLTWFARNEALLKPQPLWTDGGHKYVWHVRYSPAGNYVAAVSTDGTLNVYKSKTGEVMYRKTGPVKGTVKKPMPVPFHSLDWSPDGLVIAVGAADNNIYVFRAHDGAPYDRLVGHAETITDLAFSPDSRSLASTGGGPKLSMQYHEAVEGPDNFVHFWARK